jgi:hypothetical protein
MGPLISEKEKEVWAGIVARPTGQVIFLVLLLGLFWVGFIILKFVVFLLYHAIAWGLNTEGLDPEEARRKKRITWTVIGSILALMVWSIHRIPVVNDSLWLSKCHTTNIDGSWTVYIPGREHFTVREYSEELPMRDRDGYSYKTYKESMAHTEAQLMSQTCQLVPRGREATLTSEYAPSKAAGFIDEVAYLARFNVLEVPGYHYYTERFWHPSYLWKDKEELSQIYVTVVRKVSWKAFLAEWNNLETRNGLRTYTVEALWNEHALACL